MSGRIEAQTEPVDTQVDARQEKSDAARPTLVRDPVVGILVAVVLSAIVWPALLVIWLYVLR